MDEDNTNQQNDEQQVIQPNQEDTAPQFVNPTAQQTSSADSTEITPASNKRGKKLIKLLLVMLVVAALGVTGWYFWNKSQPVEVTKKAETQDIETFRFGTVEGPANSYFPVAEGAGISVNESRQIYEGLIGSKDKKFVPLLAESWTNPDSRTWVFKLKPNVKFHTGKTMTASDVKASFDKLKDYEFWSSFITTIENVEVLNDQEVKITTTEPDALLLNRLSLAFIFDTSAMDKMGNNGTGAYQLDNSKDNTEDFVALKAFDDYHQGRPKTRNIEYIIYKSEDDVVDAMKTGKIDYTEIHLKSDHDQQLKDAGFVSQTFESPGVFGMFMNIDREGSPLKDIEVRKAIAMAVDRKSMLEELGDGNVPAMQVIPKSLPGHDADLSFPEYNPTKAKETLLAAYPDGITLEFAYFKDVQLEAPILIKQLREAGFTIEEKAFTDPAVLTETLKNADLDLFTASYLSDLLDSRDILGSLLGSESLYKFYTDDEAYQKLLNDSDKEFDPTKRIAILQEANRYVTENLLWLPVRKTEYVAYYPSDFDIQVDYEGGSNLGFYNWHIGQNAQ